jgi:ADP-heptose:LPS heptosyltransferase
MSYAYTNKFLKVFAAVFDFCGSILFFWIPKNREIKDNEVNKILIVKLDQLGDCFLMTPIFEYLKNKFPKSQIDLVCQENARPIFDHNPFISNIITFNYWRMYRGKNPEKFRDFLRLVQKLRKEKYDLFIDPRGEPLVALLGFKIGAKYRLGFEKEEVGGFFYTHPLRYDRHEHETERYKKIISLLGGSVTTWNPRIYLTDAELVAGERIIGEFGGDYIVIHPGAGVPYKIWPEEYFAEIIQKTFRKYNGEVILLGGKEEKRIGDTLVEIVKDKRLKNMMGQLSLRETYFSISRAKAFLGNDSALVHFAGALDVPTIDLMNVAVSERRWRPLGKHSIVISGSEKNHACSYGNCPYPCPNMAAITVDDVASQVLHMLSLER